MEGVLENDQVLVHVLRFLEPWELLSASTCCKFWHTAVASHGKLLWLPHTIINWSEYTVNVPNIWSYTIVDRIRSLSHDAIRSFLDDYNDKDEYLNYSSALVKLLFHDHISKRRRERSMLHRYGQSTVPSLCSTVYPKWALQLEPHKATYVHSKIDIRRDIYLSELVLIQWEFKFRFSIHEQPLNFVAKFELDGTLVINISTFVHQYQVGYLSHSNLLS